MLKEADQVKKNQEPMKDFPDVPYSMPIQILCSKNQQKTMKIPNSEDSRLNAQFIEEEFKLMPLKLQISNTKKD